jgi:L,D-peptidoglycan transpeptidase YkuD (ErfK/YbiS/YcfS/YnhG family)
MARGVPASVAVLLVLAMPALGSSRTTLQQSVAKLGAACPDTLANQLATTRGARQLVTVVAATGRSTRGWLRLWRKSGDCWLAAGGPWTAWLGARGVSENRHEGDRTTPAGAYDFQRTMYGVGPNPGVRYAYRRIVCGDWWVEDPKSPSYNRFRHVRCGSKPPFRVTSEDARLHQPPARPARDGAPLAATRGEAADRDRHGRDDPLLTARPDAPAPAAPSRRPTPRKQVPEQRLSGPPSHFGNGVRRRDWSQPGRSERDG